MNPTHSSSASETDDVERMLAEWKIRNVIAGFARAVDRRDAQRIRDCYHPDAHIHYGVFDGNLDEYVPWVVSTVSETSMTMHFHGPSIIDWPVNHGVRIALVETYAVAVNQTDGVNQSGNWVSGIRYLDRFESRTGPTSGGWRIAERTTVGEWLRIDPTSNHRRFSKRMTTGSAGPSDPVFAILTQLDGGV